MNKDKMIPFSEVNSFNCDTIKKSWWKYYAKHENLSEADMEKYADYFDWTILCCNQYMSEDFIRKFFNRIDVASILSHKKLSEELIEEICWCCEYTEWKNVWEYQKVSEAFIEKHIKHAVWHFIPRYQKLSKEFWMKYWNKMDKEIFFEKVNLKEGEIRTYIEKAVKDKPEYEGIYWAAISEHQKMSEDFIREFASKIKWYHLADNKKKLHLSKEFKNEMLNAGYKLYSSIHLRWE